MIVSDTISGEPIYMDFRVIIEAGKRAKREVEWEGAREEGDEDELEGGEEF